MSPSSYLPHQTLFQFHCSSSAKEREQSAKKECMFPDIIRRGKMEFHNFEKFTTKKLLFELVITITITTTIIIIPTAPLSQSHLV